MSLKIKKYTEKTKQVKKFNKVNNSPRLTKAKKKLIQIPMSEISGYHNNSKDLK